MRGNFFKIFALVIGIVLIGAGVVVGLGVYDVKTARSSTYGELTKHDPYEDFNVSEYNLNEAVFYKNGTLYTFTESYPIESEYNGSEETFNLLINDTPCQRNVSTAGTHRGEADIVIYGLDGQAEARILLEIEFKFYLKRIDLKITSVASDAVWGKFLEYMDMNGLNLRIIEGQYQPSLDLVIQERCFVKFYDSSELVSVVSQPLGDLVEEIPTIASTAGRAFLGWSRVPGGSEVAVESYRPAGNVAFYALFAYDLTGATVAPIARQTYTGTAVMPALTVSAAGQTLRQGIDYGVTFKNNINTGIATAIISTPHNPNQTLTATFEVIPMNIEALYTGGVKLNDFVYKNNAVDADRYHGFIAQPPVLTLSHLGKTLSLDLFTITTEDYPLGGADAKRMKVKSAANTNYSGELFITYFLHNDIKYAVFEDEYAVASHVATYIQQGGLSSYFITMPRVAATLIDQNIKVTTSSSELGIHLVTVTGQGSWTGSTQVRCIIFGEKEVPLTSQLNCYLAINQDHYFNVPGLKAGISVWVTGKNISDSQPGSGNGGGSIRDAIVVSCEKDGVLKIKATVANVLNIRFCIITGISNYYTADDIRGGKHL